ncbi:MAG: hypothetical protein U5R06_06620 [candidate division KSB1 bacterium]|nr:hypothetical protein [candidate division KSB1 bacterium]
MKKRNNCSVHAGLYVYQPAVLENSVDYAEKSGCQDFAVFRTAV